MKDNVEEEDALKEFEIFAELDEFWEELEEEESEDDTEYFVPGKVYRAELYLNQEELVKERISKYNVTKEELTAIQEAASAVHQYRREGKVEKNAMEFIEEVAPGDVKRQVRLLNIVIPLARTFKVSAEEKKQHSYYDRRKER